MADRGRRAVDLPLPIDVEFGTTDGLHGIRDVHFNQGNVGAHVRDNGPMQDGGLILMHPDRLCGIFLAFQTQRLPTDLHGRSTFLGPITVDPGASVLVTLDGAGAQLSNKGGNLALLDPTGRQVDSVVYTALDAKVENQFVRFHPADQRVRARIHHPETQPGAA